MFYKSAVIPLHKKEDLDNSANFRTITIIAVFGKGLKKQEPIALIFAYDVICTYTESEVFTILSLSLNLESHARN